MQEQQKLLNIHQVLKNAALNPESEDDEKTVATFRLTVKSKQLAETICATNGTDLSKFLRECVKTLVSDYLCDQEPLPLGKK